MKRAASVLAFLLITALPMAAQSTSEFGVMYGGSRRVIKATTLADGTVPLSSGFKFSNSAVDVYYALQLDRGTLLKVQVGRIESPVAIRELDGGGKSVRRDVDGQVTHAEGIIEYRFSEPLGSTGLFAGLGAYRQGASGFSSTTNWGIPLGVTADFPMTRTYGFLLAATYHFTNADFRPKYLTISGGLRMAF